MLKLQKSSQAIADIYATLFSEGAAARPQRPSGATPLL